MLAAPLFITCDVVMQDIDCADDSRHRDVKQLYLVFTDFSWTSLRRSCYLEYVSGGCTNSTSRGVWSSIIACCRLSLVGASQVRQLSIALTYPDQNCTLLSNAIRTWHKERQETFPRTPEQRDVPPEPPYVQVLQSSGVDQHP